ncbi:HAMP domain-containing sensor histidine kinase [uncultured Duncaniella sp.]|uniref:sensor histidine kinase n=1 Tax=uncultured Duncaniella sp. TaxID=2768039 RepID=UPI002675587B|nr:HAMP domain-containing sensor histidine kinase [uncultured Duncaniella sp.]
MSRNIYDIRRYGIIIFMVMSMAVVGVFLYYSDSLVRDLAQQERARMEIWANATREIVKSAGNESDQADSSTMDFLMSIIEDNRNIPVLLTDGDGNIMMHRNFSLPEPPDPTAPLFISERNEKFLRAKLDKMVLTPNVIEIDMGDGERQYLYYEDSSLLKALNYYPYIQIIVLIVFIAIVYFAVSSTKRAEQNKIWVGLSKETAHQLGTPISSLMAWIELLDAQGTDKEIINEMDKDLKRLSTIASRFSKIGSRPTMEAGDLNTAMANAAGYMSTRISRRIKLTTVPSPDPLPVRLSTPLIEWVMENLIKNAVDATSGSGTITITAFPDKDSAVIEVSDTGKGISKKMQRHIFNPGFTTKERGWGLGLTLSRRIIEEYHDGHIFIKRSELGVGTTFTIEVPLIKKDA